jgi:uncharacterized repeat protein (TIGR01451 family)
MTSTQETTDRFSICPKEKTAMSTDILPQATHRPRRRSRLALMCLAVIAVAMTWIATPAALAGTPEFTLHSGAPDTVEPGEMVRMFATAVNSGTAPFTGTVSVSDTLPGGFELLSVESNTNYPWPATCKASGQRASCTFEVTELLPIGQLGFLLVAKASAANSGTNMNRMEVQAGGSPPDIQLEEPMDIAPAPPFGLKTFAPAILRAGNLETQAGASPEVLETDFSMPTIPFGAFGMNPFGTGGTEHFRNVTVHSPPGMIVNLHATSEQCTASQLVTPSTEAAFEPACPEDSQIGMVRLFGGFTTVPIYNMVAPPGVPAMFGFEVFNVPITIEARLRPDDFGFDLVTRNVNTSVPLSKFEFTFWGVPADSSHDTSRGLCVENRDGNTRLLVPDGLCPTSAPRRAFIRLPTSCTGPLKWGIEMDTYEHPGVFSKAETITPGQVGCNQLEFTPTLKARPTTNLADAPSGLEFNVHLPQNEDPEGLAEAQLKDLTTVLPKGLTVNAASADGLGSCSPQQIGMITPVGQVPAHFSGDHAQCPDSSKLGSVSVFAPAVGRSLPGKVYLATPHQNPFGSLLALYLAIDDPQTGIIVNVPVKVESDPSTGQLTTVVNETAPLPFEDLKVELDQGPHAALLTPISCGHFVTSSDLTPWSAPEGQDAHPSDTFEIVNGAGGGPCASSEATAPATLNFEAGTLEPRAGAYSPLVLKLGRKPGGQQIKGIDATLPKGLLARLSYSTYCSESALAAAAEKTGHAERAEPSCPVSSEIGSVDIAVGGGPAPMHIPGKAYITGPYKGAPLGLAVITPAVAGPFDLGTVVTRVAIQINPETAEVTAHSDPLPYSLEGLPVDLRQLTLNINRPNYILNPTSCDPMALTGAVTLLSGQTAAVSSPFQVGGCNSLSFKPKLALRLRGGTTRTAHPALTATVSFPKPGGANVAKASVALPRSEFLDQSHIGTICTRVQFAAHACPAKSVYGTAKAITPLLAQPLEGPVYLRSSNHELPDLVAALNGQFEVDLVGRIDSKNGGIRTTFESVPDAPVSIFTLKMQGGKKGLLQNSTNLCQGQHRATALFEAQSGMSVQQRPELKAKCGKPKKAKTKHHGRRGR